jgi:NAD(P)-dependent dehydrogenase (short-subunit alcohol dehydrogenase family)
MEQKIFDGKVAIVTGAASGIGRAGARLFAREGATVLVVTGSNVAGGEETVRMIKEAGGEASFARCDVSCEEDVKAMVEECVSRYGRLDYAFNNAGIGPDGVRVPVVNIVDCSADIWKRTLDVNLTGVFYCLKYEMRQMIEQGEGAAIVNTSSVGAVKPLPGFSAYSASKAGLNTLTKTAALEGAPHGVRVNTIMPGPTQNTLLFEHLTTTAPEEKVNMMNAIPLKRIADPEDMAEAVIWLCSDRASFITGHCAPIDGGLSCG